MEAICARHGLSTRDLVRAREGTSIVFTAERHVIKLYPPFWALGAAAEVAILGHVGNELGVAIPHVLAAGHLEAWPYVVITRLGGVILGDVWPTLSERARRSLARQLGEVLARLHSLPTGPLSGHPVLTEGWVQLVSRPIEECVAIHREHGAPEAWLARLPQFLERLPPLHPASFDPVLVHGDVHGSHLLVGEHGGKWRLVGLFDFDSSMLGWWEYEFVMPALSLMAGQPAVLLECFRGYGSGQLVQEGISRRLMAYALLNRYWGLDFMLDVGDPDHRYTTFEELERALFTVGRP
jgi:aminoglycoside phosphotransferase (APT) family kinase protein